MNKSFRAKIPLVLMAIILMFPEASFSLFKNENNKMMNKNIGGYRLATFGGGCFWCIEAIFHDVKGVISAKSGYSGGETENPSYRDVCSGATGHAEVVHIEFDPDVITYHDILTIFFNIHDPTTLNRQGADIGTQYRSVIFYHDESQKNIAGEVMDEIVSSGLWRSPIVTEISPFTKFFEAEDYHQDYYTNNPNASYCNIVINPKITKFRKNFSRLLK